MRLIATLILTLWTLLTFGQTDRAVRGKQFKLKGKINNEVSLTPGCGTIAWGTVIELEIIEFSDSDYKSNVIGVIVTCPEFYKANFFQVGQTYTITLADENQADFDWAIPNEATLDKYKLKKQLWVIKADREL
jgi:hypothetical protein